jgi:hypothetical protein
LRRLWFATGLLARRGVHPSVVLSRFRRSASSATFFPEGVTLAAKLEALRRGGKGGCPDPDSAGVVPPGLPHA